MFIALAIITTVAVLFVLRQLSRKVKAFYFRQPDAIMGSNAGMAYGFLGGYWLAGVAVLAWWWAGVELAHWLVMIGFTIAAAGWLLGPFPKQVSNNPIDAVN